jgi:AcrR family transcriptional regulator
VDTKDRILDAAADVMTRLGLARTTTKEIARAAGCSEALLYKHFRDKEEIFLGVLTHREPRFPAVLTGLLDRSGTTLREDLVEVVASGVRFYAAGMAIGTSMLGDPVLVARQREWLRARGTGPQKPNEWLAGHLRGRLPAGADPDAAAAMLLGACFQRAFLVHLLGPDAELHPPADEFAAAVVDTLLAGQ